MGVEMGRVGEEMGRVGEERKEVNAVAVRGGDELYGGGGRGRELKYIFASYFKACPVL